MGTNATVLFYQRLCILQGRQNLEFRYHQKSTKEEVYGTDYPNGSIYDTVLNYL